MKIETLPVSVGVRVLPLREAAERGDEEAVKAAALGACATGAADEHVRARLASIESGEEMLGDGLVKAIRRFYTDTKLRDRTRRREHWRWPLFVIGCPDVAGAQTELTVDAQQEVERGWSLKLFGSGVEDNTTLTITDRITGTASPGANRILFAGHDVDIVAFDCVRGERVVSQGTRIELVGSTGVVGWADLPSAPAWMAPATKLVSLHYRMAKPGAVQQWSRELSYSHRFELVFGPELQPIALGATMSYELSTNVLYRVSLPGGRDWDVARPDRCAGVTVTAAQ